MTELVTDYLEGRMERGDAWLFELHLSMCPACVTFLEQIRVTLAMLGELPKVGLSPELEAGLVLAFRDWKKTG